MKLPIYNCIIDEKLDDETGIYAMSFVDYPANEADFITLARQKKNTFRSMHKNKFLQESYLNPNN